MRKRRALRQQELAEQAHTGQSAISRIEQQDYDGWTFKTLLNIAVALKARLRIRLEAFEDVVGGYKEHEIQDLRIVPDDQGTARSVEFEQADSTGRIFENIESDPGSATSVVM